MKLIKNKQTSKGGVAAWPDVPKQGTLGNLTPADRHGSVQVRLTYYANVSLSFSLLFALSINIAATFTPTQVKHWHTDIAYINSIGPFYFIALTTLAKLHSSYFNWIYKLAFLTFQTLLILDYAIKHFKFSFYARKTFFSKFPRAKFARTLSFSLLSFTWLSVVELILMTT